MTRPTQHLRPIRTRLWQCRHCPTLANYRNSRWQPQLPVSVAAFLNIGRQPTLVNVNRVNPKSGMVTNVGESCRCLLRLRLRNYLHFQFTCRHLKFR
jgi:hypothetical protein